MNINKYLFREGNLGVNGYMYMYGSVSLLSTWNYHNIVNWLYTNTKQKVLKKTSVKRINILSTSEEPAPKPWFWVSLSVP